MRKRLDKRRAVEILGLELDKFLNTGSWTRLRSGVSKPLHLQLR